MKNKKLIYLLVPLTFGVWGYIGYFIYSTINKDEYIPEINVSKQKKHTNKPIEKDYSLFLNYRDPFLGKISSQQNTNKVPKASKPKTEVNNTILNNIKYLGLIKNKEQGNIIASININHNDYLLKKGDKINGVEILKINSDSLQIKIENKNYYIKKSL